MDEAAAFDAHRRYLATLRDACSYRPALHRHQLVALDRERALAAEQPDLRAYLRSSGDVFEVARAMWLDRLANRAASALSTGDAAAAEGAAVEYEHAAAARGHVDWPGAVATGGTAAEPIVRRGIEATTTFTSLVLSLLAVHTTGGSTARADARHAASGALAALVASDPSFDAGSLDREPRYALRLPWSVGGRAVVHGWLRQLGDLAREPAPPQPPDPLARIAAAEAIWRGDLRGRAQSGGDPAVLEAIRDYRDPREDAADAASALRAAAGDALARQAVWPDPIVGHHWRSLVSALDDVGTLTEVDAVAAHADACFAVEADWNLVFLTSLLAPLRAAFAFGWAPSADAEDAVGFAAGATFVLYGVGPRTVLTLPRVSDFLRHAVARQLAGAPEAGAYRGEGGGDVVREASAWAAVEGVEAPDGDRLADGVVELLDALGTREPARDPRPLSLWGTEFELDDASTALGRPARPPIAGAAAVPAAGAEL